MRDHVPSTGMAGINRIIPSRMKSSSGNRRRIMFSPRVLGRWEGCGLASRVTYTPIETSDFDEDDRLFSIGNGTGSGNRSDAMVVYKSGKTELDKIAD